MKVLFLCNVVAPYQVPLIAEISRTVDFTALSIVQTPKSRLKLGWSDISSSHNLRANSLPSIRFPTPFGPKELSFAVFNLRLYLQYDVIIVGGYASLSSLVAIFFSKLFRRKLIIRTGTHALSVTNSSYLLKLFKSFVLRQAHSLIAYGTQASIFARNLGFRRKIFIEYDTVDVKEFSRKAFNFRSNPSLISDFKSQHCGIDNASTFHLVFVGQLIHRKNISVLVRAIDILTNHFGNTRVQVSIFGSGPIKTDLINDISLRNLNPFFRFCQSIPYDSIYQAYCSANLLIVPSLKDPFPLVVNESMACGTPVMLSRNCGNSFDSFLTQIHVLF